MDMMGRVDLAMTGPVGLPTRARVARPMTVRAGHATMVPEVRVTVALGERESFALQYAGEV